MALFCLFSLHLTYHLSEGLWKREEEIFFSCAGKGYTMAKYLFRASYKAAGTKGLIEEGGTKRREQIKQIIEKSDGKLEAFYFAYGETDVFCIADLPDTVTATAMSLAINQTGAVHVSTTPLITSEEVDQASRMTIAYRPPGA
jgi:uncharacterized protein with GYD domain